MAKQSASIAVAIILIIVILVLLIGYSYYPSSLGDNDTNPVVDIKAAQQAAARRQKDRANLSGGPCKERDAVWKRWTKANAINDHVNGPSPDKSEQNDA